MANLEKRWNPSEGNRKHRAKNKNHNDQHNYVNNDTQKEHLCQEISMLIIFENETYVIHTDFRLIGVVYRRLVSKTKF